MPHDSLDVGFAQQVASYPSAATLFEQPHSGLGAAFGIRPKPNTVHLSTLIAFLISIDDSGLFVRRRSGKLLILRLTPRKLRRLRLETTRSCRISSRTVL
jgi:hypothetical protein